MQRRFEISRELSTALYVGLAIFACAELLGVIGSGLRLYEKVFSELAAGTALHDYGSITLNFVLLLAFARPGRRAAAFVLIAGALLDALLLQGANRAGWSPWTWIYAAGNGFGMASILVFGAWIARGDQRRRLQGSAMLAATVLMTMYAISIDSFLELVSRLHPLTFDFVAWLIDGSLGFQPSQIIALVVRQLPGGNDLLNIAYGTMPYGFAILFSLQQREGARAPANIFSIFVVSALVATLFYQLCPIAGPSYVFRGDFPLSVPASELLPHTSSIVISIAPRNGFPSMHLGWALLLWMNAAYVGPRARAAFAVLVGLTVLATLGLGEHYLVDLAAGVPAAVALQALCTHVLPWRSHGRRRAALFGFALVLGWIGAVRFGVELFLALPGLTWAAMLGTLWASVMLYRRLARETHAALAAPDSQPKAPATAIDATAHRELWTVGLLFGLSGFAGLMYQMLAARSLTLIAGSTAPAICALLATSMGGLAIGAWLGGRIAAQRDDVLQLYSYSQMGIGLLCLANPWIFQGAQGLYVALAASIPPAVFMGMGLPLLARFCQGRTGSLGASIALLARAGTIGAAIGAPLAGCLLIPALGMLKTMLVTAVLHLVVAAFALRFSGRVAGQAPDIATQPASTPDDRSLGALTLALLMLGGAIALGLGVNYVHLLAVVAGDSVYAGSLMQFACLLGLAGGAEVARRLILARLPLAPCLGWIEFALAAVALLGAYQWTALPEYFSSFAFYPVADAFGTRELIRGLVSCVVMVPPALVIGAFFPLAIEAVGRAWPEQPIRALGRASALYALGGGVGILATGLLSIPWLGSLRSIQGLALMCLLLGLGAIGLTAWRSKPLHWAPAGALLALFCLQPASFDYTALASGASIHFAPHHHEQVIDQAESLDGGLITVSRRASEAQGEASLALRANGYLLGDEGGMDASLLLTKARARALVIGYGTGVSAHALREAGFAQVDIVEPRSDVVRLADAHFADRNGRVSQQRNVAMHIVDARIFLMRQSNVYDLVSMESGPIWLADAASFYNREFYRLAKDRLRADGVLQQRVPLHHLSPLDLLYILGSVRAEFSQVWLYSAGTLGTLVATSDSTRAPSAAALAGVSLLDPARVDRLLASYGAPPSRWVSTDDNRYLEYATPRGNALDGAESSRALLEFLQGAGGASR